MLTIYTSGLRDILGSYSLISFRINKGLKRKITVKVK